jgi:hypothetical protein
MSLLPFARHGEPPAGYAAAVKAVAGAVRRGLAAEAGYGGVLEAARAANAGTLPDRTVVAIVDYGIAALSRRSGRRP